MTNIEARDHLRDITKMVRNNANIGAKPELAEALEIACAALDKLIEKPDVAEHKDAFEQAYRNGYAAALREERNG